MVGRRLASADLGGVRMGVEDLVAAVMRVFELLKDVAYVIEDGDSVIIDTGDYIVTKKFKKGRVEFKLMDSKSGEVLGYIETDGEIYYNVIGSSNWEDFIVYVGW